MMELLTVIAVWLAVAAIAVALFGILCAGGRP